jgi:hypothetical protein
MYRVIHHSTTRVCSALLRAIADRFGVPERYLYAGCDLAASTPDKKVYALFFDSETMLADHRYAMSRPINGHITVVLVGAPPTTTEVHDFIMGFEYGMMFAEDQGSQ